MLTIINSNRSILGQTLLDWINAPNTTKTDKEIEIATKLYYKYVIDRDGKPKNKIYPTVWYYVNYNNQYNRNVYLAYIVRDKLKSPRRISDALAELDLVGSMESYKGSTICEWAYYQNASSNNPYYMEGCEIVTKYLESDHPLKKDVYYYISNTSRGIRIFRDIDKSPRQIIPVVEPSVN